MKEYIITIITTAVLCKAVHILTPQGSVKYIKIITGLIILSVIAAPLSSITKINPFSEFSLEEADFNQNIQTDAVSYELKLRLEQDINERIKTEFFTDAKSEVTIQINENHEITGVLHIKIITTADKHSVRARICEVYGVDSNGVEIYEP